MVVGIEVGVAGIGAVTAGIAADIVDVVGRCW